MIKSPAKSPSESFRKFTRAFSIDIIPLLDERSWVTFSRTAQLLFALLFDLMIDQQRRSSNLLF